MIQLLLFYYAIIHYFNDMCVCVCVCVFLFTYKVWTSYYALYHLYLYIFPIENYRFQLPYIVFHFCINVFIYADTMLTME